MIKRWFHSRERRLAMRDDNRIVRPFEWGTEFVDSRFVNNSNGISPDVFLHQYAQETIRRSDEFFALPEITDYELTANNQLSWTSQTQTLSAENNTVRARFFPVEKPQQRKRAVVILPHWNAQADSYIALCKVLNKFGIAALRLTLPYHEERMPPELDRADYLVSPNVGRTLQSGRQAVLDTKAAVRWLKTEGYESVGVVGTSIGSCTGFLAMVHDESINVGVFNHVSGYFADVVWRGISTYHVRQSLESQITLDQLREYWLQISPMAYMKKLGAQPSRPMHYIYTLYDLSFPLDLSRETITAFKQHNIKFDKTVLPCGHYTLGEPPWVYFDGWKIVTYFRKHL